MSENMADNLKRKLSAKSITAIILFGAIIMVFVFFGMPASMGVGAGYVARVNNSLISFADFQQEENRIQQYYQSLFGGQMDLSSQRQLLRQQALENLVRMELVSQASEANGILATDAEVRNFIVTDIPAFQQNGFFQRDTYGRYLESIRSSPAHFESKVRKDIVNVRTRALFEIVTQPTSMEKKALDELRGRQINVQFARIDKTAEKGTTPEKLEAEVKVLEEALQNADEAAVNAQLKKLKVSWEETGLVDLSNESLPKLTSSVATEAVYDLKKTEPLLKRLVRDGATRYVLRLKEVKSEVGKALEPSVLEMTQKRRGDGMFEAWVNDFRANSNVKMNSQAMQLM